MRISANAIAINDRGEVLLILRDDLRVWSVPGGMLDPNEPPETAVVREVWEETGLEVKPVRLLGLQYWPLKPLPTLEFNYLCQVQGGDLRPSPESPQVGFFSPASLPHPMLPARRDLIKTAFSAGPSPIWQTNHLSWWTNVGWWWLINIAYPLKNLRRKWQGNPYIPPPSWQVEVIVVLQDEQARILWLRPNEATPWRLPSCIVPSTQVPWETASQVIGRMTSLQLELRQLLKIDIHQTGNKLTLIFAAEAKKTLAPESHFDYFLPDQEPTDSHRNHLGYVHAANLERDRSTVA